MKNIKTYQLFEAKQKTDWKKLYVDKLTELKESIDRTFKLKGININNLIEFLLLELNDISKYNYEEYIKLEGEKNNITVYVTGGEYNKPNEWFTIANYFPAVGVDSVYNKYNMLTNFLDKNKKFSIIYNIYFEQIFNDSFYKHEILFEELNNAKLRLQKLGFKIKGDNYFTASIELDKLEGFNTKTLDLSDLFPKNIVDDFEKFILKKNLSRKDAEEIASIIKKMDTQS